MDFDDPSGSGGAWTLSAGAETQLLTTCYMAQRLKVLRKRKPPATNLYSKLTKEEMSEVLRDALHEWSYLGEAEGAQAGWVVYL